MAALAALEFEANGWNPTVTTFGEPRIGNSGLNDYINFRFDLVGNTSQVAAEDGGRYRRVTHIDDPVPLLPLREWGYKMHAGEIYIEKPALAPMVLDIRLCVGNEDKHCIASSEVDVIQSDNLNKNLDFLMSAYSRDSHQNSDDEEKRIDMESNWAEIMGLEVDLPTRYKIWHLFFAHRDYFWRLGLCVPGGDPANWGHTRSDFRETAEQGNTDALEL